MATFRLFFSVQTRLAVLAGLVGLYSLWLLAADIISQDLPRFPSDPAALDAAFDHRVRAKMAAWIGHIRGDLWTRAAIADAAPQLRQMTGKPDQGATRSATEEAARASAERAVVLAPLDSRAWLLLAAINSSHDRQDRQAIEALKMSYFTGPNETDLMPLRLLVATRSRAMSDPDIEQLARLEIRTIVGHRPELQPAIAAAYRQASSEGKTFIETALKDVDPRFLNAITQSGARN